eukprot:6946871-Pyramimonas_sp.AAC.1
MAMSSGHNVKSRQPHLYGAQPLHYRQNSRSNGGDASVVVSRAGSGPDLPVQRRRVEQRRTEVAGSYEARTRTTRTTTFSGAGDSRAH